MNRNLKLFYHSALRLQLACTYLQPANILRIDLGPKPYYFYFAISPINYGASIYLAKNKWSLNSLLRLAGFPVPKAISFTKDDWLQKPLAELIASLHFPLVAKPMVDTMRGKDVLCNIKNMHQLSDYLNSFFKDYQFVQIEQFHSSLKEYRVLVFKYRVIGVIERTAAYVTGDGQHTIAQLIAIKNEERIRLGHDLTISPLLYDIEYQYCLEEQGLSLDSIVSAEEKIRLCYTVNTGRGGDILSQGKKIHPFNAKQVCAAARTIGLDYVGFDILCEDINKPFQPDKWLIIEANYCADTTLHEIPNQGIKANVVDKILRQIIYRHPLAYLYHRLTKGLSKLFF